MSDKNLTVQAKELKIRKEYWETIQSLIGEAKRTSYNDTSAFGHRNELTPDNVNIDILENMFAAIQTMTASKIDSINKKLNAINLLINDEQEDA